MKIKLRHKVIGLAIFSALIPVLALTFMILSQQERVVKRFDKDLDALVDKDLTDTVSDLTTLCYMANKMTEQQVYSALRVAQKIIRDKGSVYLSDEMVSWHSENEWNREREDIELPKMVFGDEVIEKNFNSQSPTPIVDEIHALVGCVVSIFQVMNDRGDMLRIATTLERQDGSRNIGQFFSGNDIKHDPDNTIARVLKGEKVYSTVYFYNQWFIFAAAPIYDSRTGNVIGMVRTAVNQFSLMSLQKAISDINLGEDGFVWIMQGKSRLSVDRANFIYPKKTGINTIKLNRLLQEKGFAFFDAVRNTAIQTASGEIHTERFKRSSDDMHPSISSTVKYVYFPEWDWVIGIVASDKDFLQMHDQLREPFQGLIRGTLLAGLGGLCVVLMIAFVLGGIIAKPITNITKIALKVADGDLNTASSLVKKATIEEHQGKGAGPGQDETGQLMNAINRMIDNLNSLIGQVKFATAQLISSTTQITSTSKLQENTVTNFKESTGQIAYAVENISDTSQELFSTMCNVSEIAQESGKMARDGSSQLEELKTMMQNLAQATAAISAKLTVIKQKAANINAIITTISKVADQANLLSVNASIEAEKAGEYGQGFAVVAREIGRLGDQTSIATADVEQMVREMHAAISAGAVEMDQFSDRVSYGEKEVSRIISRFQDIIQKVLDLTPRFEMVKDGMQSQSKGARDINDAMMALTQVAKQSADSLERFGKAQYSLEVAIDGLRTEVSKFEIKDYSRSQVSFTTLSDN